MNAVLLIDTDNYAITDRINEIADCRPMVDGRTREAKRLDVERRWLEDELITRAEHSYSSKRTVIKIVGYDEVAKRLWGSS